MSPWPSSRAEHGVPVCTAIGDQWSPVLAPDGVGGAYVCWADYRGIGGPVYIQHIEASGLPASGWLADGMPVRRSGTPDYEGWHTVLADGGGGAFVAWFGGDGAGYNYELRAMRLRANGTLETGWPDTGVLLASGRGAYLGLTACHDGSGGIYLAWQDSHLSTDVNQQDVFVARVLANGGLPSGWSVGGRAVCTKPGSQWMPRIATDGIDGPMSPGPTSAISPRPATTCTVRTSRAAEASRRGGPWTGCFFPGRLPRRCCTA